MSTLQGNPLGEEYGSSKGLSAEVVSALIIAHELRTANLIAYAEQMRRDRTSGTNAATTEVLMTVEERLGLGEK